MLGILKVVVHLGVDIVKTRVFNKKTPAGISLIIAGALASGYLDSKTAEMIILLLSKHSFYAMVIQGSIVLIFIIGIRLIWAKTNALVKHIEKD